MEDPEHRVGSGLSLVKGLSHLPASFPAQHQDYLPGWLRWARHGTYLSAEQELAPPSPWAAAGFGVCPLDCSGADRGTDRVRGHLGTQKGRDEGVCQGSGHRHAPKLSRKHIAAAIKAWTRASGKVEGLQVLK